MASYHASRILRAALAAGLLLAAAGASADTLFTWTDAEGIRHFSNLRPPREVGAFSTIETRVSTQPCEGAKPRRRAYDEMIEGYQNEADRKNKTPQEFQKPPAQLNRNTQLDEKVRVEKQRLQYQIEQFQRRAVSPTFSQGMQAGHIRSLKERLQRLEADPQGYFRMAE